MEEAESAPMQQLLLDLMNLPIHHAVIGLAPREAAALMGLPAAMALPDTVRDATAVLGNGIEAHAARAIVVAAREALAEGARGRWVGAGAGATGTTP